MSNALILSLFALSHLAFLALAGCAGAPSYAPLNAGTPLSAGAEEGILIIQIDSELPLASVDLKSGRVATNLPAGKHIWMTTALVGRDGWAKVVLGDGGGRGRVIVTSGIKVRFGDEFDFDVEAGVVNYPGELIIRSNGWTGSKQHVSIRNRNHSAMAVRRLKEVYGEELGRLPIRYGGRSDDGFLDYYTEVRDRKARRAGEGKR